MHTRHAADACPVVWEAVATPKPTRPMERAIHELKRLGWQPMLEWLKWTYPGSKEPVNLVLGPQHEVEHIVRQEL